MFCASNGHIDMVEQLVHIGATVSAKNHVGWTALMFAACNGHKHVVSALVAAGAAADVDIQNTVLVAAGLKLCICLCVLECDERGSDARLAGVVDRTDVRCGPRPRRCCRVTDGSGALRAQSSEQGTCARADPVCFCFRDCECVYDVV
jgi:hypothetical protein